MLNYLADRNSFHLPAPPAWWLAGMATFDPDLVLIPSRFMAKHMLCRRVKYSRGLAPLHAGHTPDTDSQMCIQYQVVPVCTIDCRNWTMGALTHMLDNLKARDTWPHDGPLDEAGLKRAAFEGETTVTKLVDDQDTAREAAIAAENHDRIYQATGDAWRYRQHLTGERIASAGPATMPTAPDSASTN